MSLVWWIAVACAGKKAAPAAEAPDAAARLLAEEAVACAKDVPENFRIHTGYASDPDPTAAVEAARRAAQREALDALCSGKSEMRCAAIRRHFEDWKQPFHNPVTKRACAHVGVNRQWIDDDRRDQAQLEEGLRGLAARIADRVAGGLVAIEPPVWAESGCGAGDVGVVMVAELRGALAARDVKLAPLTTRGAVAVHTAVRVAGDQIVVEAELRRPGEAVATPVEGLRFARDLFAVEEGARDCRLDADLGLPGGQRDGQGGLRVWVELGVDGLLCDGDQAVPQVAVSRPARVKVWSVERTGRALLVWPPPGQDGVVQSSVSLGEVTFHPPLGGGEERLVALAVPEGSDFAGIEGWTGFCQHPGVFETTKWGTSAGVAAAVTVLPWSSSACAQRGGTKPSRPPIPVVPVCPQRLGG